MISPSSEVLVDFQLRRQRGALDRQRVVADHAELARQPVVHAALVGGDGAGLAVHLHLRAHDAPAQRRADALVPKAHAQDRQPASEVADGLHAHAGLGRAARAGREHQPPRLQRGDAGHVDLVVAHHAHVFAEFAEVLHQVEGEAVVVVDHQQHMRSNPLISLDVPRSILIRYPL